MLKRLFYLLLSVAGLAGCHKDDDDDDNGNGNGVKIGKDFTERVEGLDLKMVYVKGGTFAMGATVEQNYYYDDHEKPVHQVTLSDYYISAYPVTQGLWKAVMGTTIEEQRDKVHESLYHYGEGDNYPMYYVNWEEALEFCMKLSRLTGKTYALPTEAQWEYAARGGVKSVGCKYSGSNDIDEVAWHNDNSGNTTHAVGQKKPNELGIYDMSGNVGEWCSDWYGEGYYAECKDGVIDPAGSAEGPCRVLRGGSWGVSAVSCCVSSRNFLEPSVRGNYDGFRLVLVP